MPIYEYTSVDQDRSCPYCIRPFETLQGLHEEPLSTCPRCGNKVTKIISWCRAAVVETSDEELQVSRTVKEYERAGMWSHAAELADKHSEKTRDKELKTRALENYKKAGYDADTLLKHAQSDSY